MDCTPIGWRMWTNIFPNSVRIVGLSTRLLRTQPQHPVPEVRVDRVEVARTWHPGRFALMGFGEDEVELDRTSQYRHPAPGLAERVPLLSQRMKRRDETIHVPRDALEVIGLDREVPVRERGRCSRQRVNQRAGHVSPTDAMPRLRRRGRRSSRTQTARSGASRRAPNGRLWRGLAVPMRPLARRFKTRMGHPALCVRDRAAHAQG